MNQFLQSDLILTLKNNYAPGHVYFPRNLIGYSPKQAPKLPQHSARHSKKANRHASNLQTAAERVKLNRQLAQMLKGGVIMDVTTPEQARIAEEAGACAVMALERIPADIRAAGGV